MRTKNLILFILVIFMVLPGRALADPRTFPAGSLIIPMDSFYQPATGGGLLEAYGLVYKLLSHQNQQCISDCGEDQGCRDQCEHDISVYWVIDDLKTAIADSDLIIEVTDEFLQAKEVAAVVTLFDNTATFVFDDTNGDDHRRISYRGSVFLLDIPELTDEAATYARTLINSSEWSAVRVHEALVSFTAKVHRKMQGTPPKIALMNNTEDKTKGNAAILESYLRLAGVCTDVYEVLTPNDIAGIAPDGSSIPSRLITGGFDFLWAPHWEGEKYDGADGLAHVDDIVKEIKLFLESGKALLAECASIETFEYNANGRFLSDHGFAHNGGTNRAEDIVYNDVTSPYSQIGDFPFNPEGGHLHNWRPYQIGDDGDGNFNFDVPPTEDASYHDTVKRYTIDTEGWDYYVGGHAFGNSDFGYVVYLGGHKYAACKDNKGKAPPKPNVHPMKFEFTSNINIETQVFRLKIYYSTGGSSSPPLVINNIYSTDFGTRQEGANLQIDFTNAVINGKKIENLEFRNLTTSAIDIDYIELSWSGGPEGQQIKKIEDKYTDVKHLDAATDQTLNLDIADQSFIIETSSGVSGVDCTQNDDCSWKNIAGVRYILNTLFNIQYQISNNEFVRSAPIVAHPWLYQGSFEYSSYFGHFRRYNVTQTVATGDNPVADWDTAVGGIPDAGTGNPDADTGNLSDREVYTAQYNEDDKTWAKINFDAANVDALMVRLNVTPDNNDTTDEIKVINRLRGKDWDSDLGDSGGWVERNDPNSHAFRGNFGGIEHSAAAIVSNGDHDRRFTRKEIAYVGDLYGMLHAIDTATGKEQWAYIPSNLLGKLKNDRTNPSSVANYAAVDASPTVRDVYFDPDHDPDINPSWHTILVCPQGFGGKTVFALDVTDPDEWEVLWEVTDNTDNYPEATPPPGGGMGHAFRAALDKVLVSETNPDTGETTYHTKWMVFVATSYAEKDEDHGGIHVYAFDLKTGDRKWRFSSEYTDLSTNYIPGAVTTYDIDGDRFADRIYVGDMNGRMWELNAVDGTNPYGDVQSGDDAGDPIPLFNAGIGNPISVSPAITRRNGHVILVFGTGGTNWATVPDVKRYYIYAVDATAADNLSQDDINKNYDDYKAAIGAMWSKELEAGEKVWSSPTIAANTVFMAISGGTLESDNPRSDVSGGGRLIALDLNNNEIWSAISIGKVRGSLFVSNQHIYLTTIDNQIIQVGGDDWPSGFGRRVVLKAWRQF